MQTLPVNKTCSSGVRGQQPDHKSYLQLVVERKPGYGDTHGKFNPWYIMMLSTAEKQVKRYAPTPTPVVKFLLHTALKVYYGFLDCTDMFQHFL